MHIGFELSEFYICADFVAKCVNIFVTIVHYGDAWHNVFFSITLGLIQIKSWKLDHSILWSLGNILCIK